MSWLQARKSLGTFLIDVVDSVDKEQSSSSQLYFSKYHWYLAFGLAVETKVKGKESFYWPWFFLLPERYEECMYMYVCFTKMHMFFSNPQELFQLEGPL